MSKCEIIKDKIGIQTSHCKRKDWVLPFFCFTGVFIAIIIGYILFHYRKEQMEPILRPATFYQPRNKIFKSKFYNKHSPFKYLSYNPSMKYSGNMSSISGLKALDNRKNYHNLEIPINYINGNNFNNNGNINNYQDLDPTIYPEYDNTVEIINDNRTNVNELSRMNTINNMNMNSMNINNSKFQHPYNNNRISTYNDIPNNILSEIDSTTATTTTSITTTSMTETDTERPNDYSSSNDYYTESETTTQYTNSYYNKSNLSHHNTLHNSYIPNNQQNTPNRNNQPDLNQSYIFNNPPIEPENSYIIGPNVDNNMNNSIYNNSFYDPNINNNDKPFASSYSNIPNLMNNNIVNNNLNPHRHHMRNYSYSIKTTLDNDSREELIRKTQGNRIHRRSYSYNDDINQYKRNGNYNNNYYNDYQERINSENLRSFIDRSQSNPNNMNNIPYSYSTSRAHSQNNLSVPMSNNNISNTQLRRSPSPLLQKVYPTNKPSYIPPSIEMDNSFSVTNNTTTTTTETTTATTGDDLTTETSTTTEYSIYRRKSKNDSIYKNRNNVPKQDIINNESGTENLGVGMYESEYIDSLEKSGAYINLNQIPNNDNLSSYYIATPMDNLNNDNISNIMQTGFDNSFRSQSYSRSRSHSRSHSQSYPEVQQQQSCYNNYYQNNNKSFSPNQMASSINNINPSFSKRSLNRHNNSINSFHGSSSRNSMNNNNFSSKRSITRFNNSPSTSRTSPKSSFYRPSTHIYSNSREMTPGKQIPSPLYQENSTNRSRKYYPSTVYS